MFKLLQEYVEDYSLKIRQISSIKLYFRKISGISTKNDEKFKNECIIVIDGNKNIYNNIIEKEEIKYWGSEKDWTYQNNQWKPKKSNKFLHNFNITTDRVYVFLKKIKNKYIFLGEYKVVKKKKNSERFIEMLREETNITELRKYEKNNIDFSKIIEKITEYSKIHNEQIKELKSQKQRDGYKCWEGKFSDLITAKNNQLTLYEFKTVHDENFLSQFMKEVGQLEVYEKNFDQLTEFRDFNKNIEKKIIFLEVQKLYYKEEYIKITGRLGNISCKF